uniref:Uncharacterized protein n=1 Tax=Trypanosoma vivax (strain Y486) TaxID=1055687 RepID=G0U9G0_TRYVY|nr:putative Hypothetical protein [Trypanosoma vivax Y486]
MLPHVSDNKHNRLFALAMVLPLSALGYWYLNKRKRQRLGTSSGTDARGSSSVSGPQPGTAPTCETDPERLKYHAILEKLKERANSLFKEGHFDAALEAYQNCIDACSALGESDAVAVRVHQMVQANVIFVFLKLKRPEEARMLATFLLQDEMCSIEGELKVKVLYRRGLASQALGDTDSALCDFNAALACSEGQRNPVVEKAIEALTK